jgi:predicted DNA-binding transcriptional regulator AlpA
MSQGKERVVVSATINSTHAIAVRFGKAGALVGLSRSQMYALAAAGKGPRSFHLGGAHLVTLDALREWLHQFENSEVSNG